MKPPLKKDSRVPLLAHWPRLLAVSVALPATIFLVDQFAIGLSASRPGLRGLLPILFVVQVGALAICAGRFIDNVFMRCVVFVWSIALVDTVAFATMFFGYGLESQCLVLALVSGQFGLLAIWGMMSRMSWPLRIPIFLASICLAVIGMMQFHANTWRNEFDMWAVILALQSVVAMGLCWLLRMRGYRLVSREAQENDLAVADHEQFQFSIKHVIFWMTAVCPILVLAKGVDLFWLEFKELYWSAVLATAMAVVSWIAMLSALGSSGRFIRFAALSLAPPFIGVLLTWLTKQWAFRWNSSNSSWFFIEIERFGFGWVAWCALAAWFLFASLLVLRSAGYRIMRLHGVAGGVVS